MALRLIEADVKLILEHLRTNLPSELSRVAALWGEDPLTLPSPQEYFPHDIAVEGYKPPCVYIVGKNPNFRLGDKESNFVNMLNRIDVAIVIQARKAPELTNTAYRYLSAATKLLQGTPLEWADGSVKITCKVERGDFSATYSNAQKPGDPAGVYRKEVVLELDVEHWEKLT